MNLFYQIFFFLIEKLFIVRMLRCQVHEIILYEFISLLLTLMRNYLRFICFLLCLKLFSIFHLEISGKLFDQCYMIEEITV